MEVQLLLLNSTLDGASDQHHVPISLTLREGEPLSALDWLGGPQEYVWIHHRRENFLSLPGIELRFVGRPWAGTA